MVSLPMPYGMGCKGAACASSGELQYTVVCVCLCVFVDTSQYVNAEKPCFVQ